MKTKTQRRQARHAKAVSKTFHTRPETDQDVIFAGHHAHLLYKHKQIGSVPEDHANTVQIEEALAAWWLGHDAHRRSGIGVAFGGKHGQ